MMKRFAYTMLSNVFGALAGLAVVCAAAGSLHAQSAYTGGSCDTNTVKKTCPNINCTTGCGPFNMGCQC